MLIIPAVDIKDGKAVRLWQGDFNKLKVYAEHPESIALEWQRQGAEFLHIVDLDGAYSGKLQNLETITKIAREIEIPFEVGGGIRNPQTIEELINLGVSRVVLGTKALEDREFLREAMERFNDKVVVSLDARKDKLASCGWLDVGDTNAIDFAVELKTLGARSIIYTDISRDGTLSGPNIKAIEDMLEAGLDLIASGGVSTLEDLKQLKALEDRGLTGVIIGKALYEKRFTLKQAILTL